MNRQSLIIEGLCKINEVGVHDFKAGVAQPVHASEKYTVFGVKCGETITEEKLIEILKKGIRKSIRNYMKNGKIGGTPISELRASEYTMKSPFTFNGITDNEIKWRSERYRGYKKSRIENGKKPPLEEWWVKIYLYFRSYTLPDLKENSSEIRKDILSMVDNHPGIRIQVSDPFANHYKKDRITMVSVNMYISYDPDIEGK